MSAASAPGDPAARLPPIGRSWSVFIAGGTGFVGRELIVRLARRGHQVRLATRNAARAEDLLTLSSVEVLSGDVYDVDFLRRCLLDCDAAINLVGVLNVPGFGAAGFRRAHVQFTTGLLTAMAEAGVHRLLHMSALNADAQRGASHYLRTKGEAENHVRRAAGVDWTIFRPSVIFGEGDALTNRFTRLLRVGGWLPLARAGTRFAPIGVADVAEAFIRALSTHSASGGTYELCGPDILTLEEIVRSCAAIAQLRCHITRLPDALGWVQAAIMGLVPGKPFSLDNFHSLRADSLCTSPGCERLGIAPASLAALAPLWLSPPGRSAAERGAL